jgi:sugar diacid utilization regulator
MQTELAQGTGAKAVASSQPKLLVVINPGAGGHDLQQTREKLARVFSESGRAHDFVPVAGPAEIPALYATLKRALPVLRRIGVDGQVVGQNGLALYSTLFETHDPASLSAFLEATIGTLLAHDRKRTSGLATTLLTYLDSNQNAKVTAQRLQIHVNTVRQRLATIEDLLGHWGNASRALEIHIALRLWSLRTAAD